MTKRRKTHNIKPRQTRLNRLQKDGIARVFDGFTVVCGVAVFSFLGGKGDLNLLEAFETLVIGIACEIYAIFLRKDK
ncbi:MAG: hypothetical protein ORN98_04670 [Alphaproteobacteria bacterium]|nr:hypothetical protein [Alphaproteobacteria bacterium]